MNIPESGSVYRNPGDFGLQSQNCICRLSCLFWAVAGQNKEPVDLLSVGIADLQGILVLEQIVVSVAH